MPDWVAKANIERYKKLLETENDGKQRLHLEQLMSEEGAKLSSQAQPRERKQG